MTESLRIFSGLAKEAESTVLPVIATWVDEVFNDTPECRAADDHGVFLWVNLPACGVLSVHRYEWVITAITNILATYRRNGVCIIVHPNRGQSAERIGIGFYRLSLFVPHSSLDVFPLTQSIELDQTKSHNQTNPLLIISRVSTTFGRGFLGMKSRKTKVLHLMLQACPARKSCKDESEDEVKQEAEDPVKKDEPDDDEDEEAEEHFGLNHEDADIRDMKYKLEKLGCMSSPAQTCFKGKVFHMLPSSARQTNEHTLNSGNNVNHPLHPILPMAAQIPLETLENVPLVVVLCAFPSSGAIYDCINCIDISTARMLFVSGVMH